MQLLDLPNEILSRISSFLDTPSPFDTRLLQKPALEWSDDGSCARFPGAETMANSLKNLSVTNHLLRTLTLPFLFEHVVLNPERLSDFLAFLGENTLKRRVSTIVAVVSGHYNHIHPAWWARLLNDVGATRFGIIAAPQILAELAGVSSWSTDAWAFDMPYQMLRFDQTPEATKFRIDYDNLPNLLEARPWTNLVVNEGSSVQAYTTYEYYFRRTPSLLSALHFENSAAGDAMFAELSSFELESIFPFYNHVEEVLKCIRKMIKLEKLFIKLCPDPNSTVLDDEIVVAGNHLDINDPWNENDTSWSLIAHNVAALTKAGMLQELRMDDAKVAGVRPRLESSLNKVLGGAWTYSGEGSGIWYRNSISAPFNGAAL